MSVLGPLFIPRKDLPPAPKTNDPELQKYLDQLSQRIHTNELSIQRWANSAPRLAAVVGPCTAIAVVWGNDNQLPIDGVVSSYYPNIVVSNTIVIPTEGWYTVSATISWAPASFPAPPFSGTVEVFLGVNASPHVTSTGTAAANFIAGPPAIVNIPDYQAFTVTGLFNKGDVLMFNAFENLTPGMPNLIANILECSVDFLGPTPSRVQ